MKAIAVAALCFAMQLFITDYQANTKLVSRWQTLIPHQKTETILFYIFLFIILYLLILFFI